MSAAPVRPLRLLVGFLSGWLLLVGALQLLPEFPLALAALPVSGLLVAALLGVAHTPTDGRQADKRSASGTGRRARGVLARDRRLLVSRAGTDAVKPSLDGTSTR